MNTRLDPLWFLCTFVPLLASAVVLEESLCPRRSIYKSLSLSLSSDLKSLSLFLSSDHVKSMNSVTATVHEDTVKNVLLTDVRDIIY